MEHTNIPRPVSVLTHTHTRNEMQDSAAVLEYCIEFTFLSVLQTIIQNKPKMHLFLSLGFTYLLYLWTAKTHNWSVYFRGKGSFNQHMNSPHIEWTQGWLTAGCNLLLAKSLAWGSDTLSTLHFEFLHVFSKKMKRYHFLWSIILSRLCLVTWIRWRSEHI